MSPERSSEEIRRDIERTRADMDETVDALEQRLSPGQLLDEAWGLMKGSGGAGGAVREHAVPLALMGLGVAWLAVEQATGRSVTGNGHATGPGTHGRADGRVGPYRGDAVSDDGEWAHRGTGEKLKDKAGSLASTAGDKASDLKERAADAASKVRGKADDMGNGTAAMGDRDAEDGEGARERAGEMAHEAADRARDLGAKAQGGFRSLLDESPLAVAALSFGLGLAGGLSTPTTSFEDRTMGGTADTLKSRAKETAEDVGHKAAAVAGETARAVKDEAKRQGIGDDLEGAGRELKESVERVASKARNTAQRSAEEEGLDAETLKARARDVGEETREKAKRDAREKMS